MTVEDTKNSRGLVRTIQEARDVLFPEIQAITVQNGVETCYALVKDSTSLGNLIRLLHIHHGPEKVAITTIGEIETESEMFSKIPLFLDNLMPKAVVNKVTALLENPSISDEEKVSFVDDFVKKMKNIDLVIVILKIFSGLLSLFHR